MGEMKGGKEGRKEGGKEGRGIESKQAMQASKQKRKD